MWRQNADHLLLFILLVFIDDGGKLDGMEQHIKGQSLSVDGLNYIHQFLLGDSE